MPNTDMSDISSEAASRDEVEQMILDEPMYYILSQFFETEDHKNIATLLQELIHELRELRKIASSGSKTTGSN
jgi:thiamine monophosphate synthase